MLTGIVRWGRGLGMAAEADIESGDAAAPEKKKLPIMLIAMIAAAVVLLGGGAGAYFMFFSAPPVDEHAAGAVHESFIFNLPTMTVNLRGESEREQFMKLTVALEVADEEVMAEIQPRMAKVVDAFQVYLRELRKSDLEGSAGIYRLKEELRRRVNIAIFPAQVDSILFKEILVQ
jgi:flagellar FliL protein